ncbi:hypothetical protein QQY66_22040 [Streptomyces sp. DG2A-72]|uniref:hypothetical protein n=1 Tax=Streptomyces sp. DG2A-72 TaxID=3051386 RepID=UPI00265BE9E0|nr:hypothetical protein [Streptomyces sp. DG2A-72]MDO0934234.1 hypothetical protein [Streptomyces sp. DG2A-72]
MKALFRWMLRIAQDLAYGIDAGHAIRLGLEPRPRRFSARRRIRHEPLLSRREA